MPISDNEDAFVEEITTTLSKRSYIFGVISIIVSVFILTLSVIFDLNKLWIFIKALFIITSISILTLILLFELKLLLSFSENSQPGLVQIRRRNPVIFILICGLSSIIFIFAALHIVTGYSGSCRSPGQADFFSMVGEAIYFSIITFTTVGYGDCAPSTGGGEFISSLEALIGYVTLGLLVSALSGIFRIK